MLDGFWEKFKSGSDIRATATDDISGEAIELTNEVVEKICLAFAKWLSGKFSLPCDAITIAVGHDSRTSANRIKNVAINALRGVGITVYDCALASTPAMFMAISVLSCTASIEITASHQPKNKNGFKFFISSGGLSEVDIEEILKIASEGVSIPVTTRGAVRPINLMNYYCQKLRNIIKNSVNNGGEKPLEGFKIVVDAGNGVGGFFAKDVLKTLGADTTGSVFLEPDGEFPNHIPNTENKDALKSISEATVNSGADLGIIFDTDVDRAAFVDSNGLVIDGSKLVALASVIALENNEKGIIVTDSVTPDNLKDFIRKLGGMQFRYKRGYSNVISVAKKINEQGENCPLAIETSGHAAFKENNFMDDGAFLACKIIIHMVNLRKNGKNLNDSINEFILAKESVRIPFDIFEKENADIIGKKILIDFKNNIKTNKIFSVEENNVEGIRAKVKVNNYNGWLLLRKSIHDPTLILYVESYVTGGIKNILKILHSFFKKQRTVKLDEFEKSLLN